MTTTFDPLVATGAADLGEVARERLASGVDLLLQCESQGNFADTPQCLRVRLTTDAMERLRSLRAACADLQLFNATANAAEVELDSRPSARRLLPWTLCLDSSCFYFEARPEGDRPPVRSTIVPFHGLYAAINGPCEPTDEGAFAQFAALCRWHGDALVCSQGGQQLQDFLRVLDVHFPAVSARERESQMAKVLAAGKTDAPDPQPAPARRSARM